MFKTITATQATVLHAVWKLQTQGQTRNHITEKELANVLTWKTARVHAAIRRMPSRCLRTNKVPDPEGKRGRPQISYRLNHRALPTMPETALILCKLDANQDPSFRVSRKQFELSISQEYQISVDFVHERINEAIKTGYVDALGREHILATGKVAADWLYLKLIKKEFKIPISKNPRVKK